MQLQPLPTAVRSFLEFDVEDQASASADRYIRYNTRYTQAHYASRSLLDVDMHCMEGRGLWSHANSCGVSL